MKGTEQSEDNEIYISYLKRFVNQNFMENLKNIDMYQRKYEGTN